MIKLLASRERIVRAGTPYLGAVLSGDAFQRFVGAVHREIIDADYPAIYNSLRNLAGQELKGPALVEASWRLAGNLKRLAAGRVVPPWTTQPDREWVTIQILRVVKRFRTFRAKTDDQAAVADTDGMVHRRGAAIRLFVMDGLPAGKTFDKFWSLDYCELIKRHFGFDRYNRERYTREVSSRPSWPFLDVSEFFRLRCQVQLDPELCKPDDLGFVEVRGTSASKKWSRSVMSLRLRDGFACPLGYPDDFACHLCHAGTDQCQAACHTSTYQVATCRMCQAPNQYVDPEIDAELCLHCVEIS